MESVIHRDIQQGTPEWENVRFGWFGSSIAHTWLVGGPDNIGSGLLTEIYRNAAKRFLGEREENYISPAMANGTALEPVARIEYEIYTGLQVEQVGYISYGDWLGYSPDGLIGDEGLIEIKCPAGKNFLRFQDTREIPREYWAQMQWGMWLSGREWCDYVVYHPVGGLVIERVFPDMEAWNTFGQKAVLVFAKLDSISTRLVFS